MNICVLTENHYKGGVDTVLINLINSWPRPEDNFMLMCNKGYPGLSSIHEKTNKKIDLKILGFFFANSNYRGFGDNIFAKYRTLRGGFLLLEKLIQYPFLSMWYLLTLTIMFKSHKGFDRLLVVNGGYPASLICRMSVIAWKMAGKKTSAVLSFHSTPSKPSFFNILPEYLIDYYVIKYSKYIIAVSNVTLKSLQKRILFGQTDKLIYIHNGIQDPLNKTSESYHYRIESRYKYCLILASYHAYKGHEYAINAFSEVIKAVPNAKLIMFGYGKTHEKRRILKQLEGLPDDNFYLGEFEDNPFGLINQSSVLLVPSQSLESFGLTIVEAMALKTPIVATDVGGIPEVIGGSGSGIVCSKNNYNEFGAAIIKILTDDNLAYTMGMNGRSTYEKKYHAEIMARKYSEILQ
jgi:L-malate glycosyltransferase